ncbi:MAG: hypothetical protein QM541_04355 [Flavobacterium sp.]|nr:hypothetical protein [Flavobacterium sp.]
MSQNKNSNSPQQSSKDLPIHVVEQIIESQKQQILLKTQELKLKEKELDINAKLAEKQMGLQAEILKSKPTETRKNFTVVGLFIVGFFALSLFFFGYCVQTGHEDFALKVFGYIMYAVTTIAGYYAGKKSGQKDKQGKNDTEIEDATIID